MYHRKECGFYSKCYRKPLTVVSRGVTYKCLHKSTWAAERRVDCRRQRGAGRPVRMLPQRRRHDKTMVWKGELVAEMDRRGHYAVRSHVLQADSTGLADERRGAKGG